MKKIVIAGLLIVQLALPLTIGQTVIGYDGEQYLRYAKNLIELGQYTYDGINPSCGRAPGYPLFLAAFIWVLHSVDFVYPVQLLLLFGAYVLIARIARDYLTAWWSIGLLGALVALWPLNRLALALMSEPLFIFLIALALYMLQRYLSHRERRFLILFAVIMTLSAYVRPVSAFFVLFAMVVLFFRRQIRWRDALLSGVLSVVIIAPWTYRNFLTFDRIIPMAATYGSVYYMTDQEEFEVIMLQSAGASHQMPAYIRNVAQDFELDPAANDRFLREAQQNISRDPLGFIKRCTLKTFFVWTYLPGTKLLLYEKPLIFYGGVLLQLCFIAAVITGAALLASRQRVPVSPGVLFAVYHLLFLFPFYAESRYLIPVYIILCGFSAYALFIATRRLPRIFARRG